MIRPAGVLPILAFLALSVEPARADDGILLSVSRGSLPEDAVLTWTGSVPNFALFRSFFAATLTNPENRALVEGGREASDGGMPPSGSCYYYLVTSVGPCSPLVPATICGADERCYPTADGLTYCAGPVGSGTQCSSCSYDDQCSSAYACIVPSNACMKWCRIGVGGDCPAFYTCYRLTPSLYAGSQEYGACYCF